MPVSKNYTNDIDAVWKNILDCVRENCLPFMGQNYYRVCEVTYHHSSNFI